MISEREIRESWDKKVAYYIKNYARLNKLTSVHEREKFFTEAHEKFIEFVPCKIKKFLDIVHS